MFGCICILVLISYLVFHIYISLKWRFYTGDFLNSSISILRSYNAFSRVWPCDDRFSSLKWSGVRDVFFTLVVSLLIYYVNNNLLNPVLLFLRLVLLLPKFQIYRIRVRDYNQAGETSKEYLKPVKSACFSSVLFSFFNYVITLICYGIRP